MGAEAAGRGWITPDAALKARLLEVSRVWVCRGELADVREALAGSAPT